MRKGVIFGVLSIFATTLFAKPTLIKYKSGKATPNYAKKIQDMGNGSYKFVLDSSKEVKGSPLTPSLVKSSLEPKLKKFKSKVKPSGAGAVIITYKGDRDKFLKKISKLKIKVKGSKTLALDSSVSDSGIRAKTAERSPEGDELKGKVVSIKGDTIKIAVTDSGGKGVSAEGKIGQMITFSGRGNFNPKIGSEIFVKPKGTGNPWKAGSFSEK